MSAVKIAVVEHRISRRVSRGGRCRLNQDSAGGRVVGHQSRIADGLSPLMQGIKPRKLVCDRRLLCFYAMPSFCAMRMTRESAALPTTEQKSQAREHDVGLGAKA